MNTKKSFSEILALNTQNKTQQQNDYFLPISFAKTKNIVESLSDNYSCLVTQNELLLIVVDDNFKITFINNTICDLLFYQAESTLDENLFSLVTPESYTKVQQAIEKIKNNANKSHKIQDLSLYCAFGYAHFFDGVVVNLTNDGRVGGYLFYLHNVTERHKIETQLKDLNLELDSFVYKASHDLRSPLTSLLGLINLVEQDFPNEAKGNFDMMKTSVSKLDKFIQQLAHYSRNNNIEANYSVINFEELLQEILDNHKYLKDADKIHIDINIEIKNLVISDVFRLRVILSNLISNAIKHHQVKQEFPFIKIDVLGSETAFVIKIEDNGMGISEEYIDKIFDMFTRATTQGDGSGLGLYIVKKGLEKLGGKIKVTSKRGQGSIFEVIVPNQIS